MQISSINLLGLGFLIGIVLILVSFAIANLTNRPVHPIKKSILIMGILLLLIYTNAISEVSTFRIALSFFLAAFLIHYILESLQDLGIIFFNVPVDKERIRKISILTYIGSAIIALLLIAFAPENIIIFVNNFVEGAVMFGIGLWVVLKLALTKNKPD